ncbi:MAG: hypothetical protein LCI00_24425 [Chloroflexi bacterium]|nr:hypothetical protein [Chloroflexota bacterium]
MINPIFEVNLIRLQRELEQAGLPIVGLSTADGTKATVRFDFSPDVTDEQRVQAANILKVHAPITAEDKRREAYAQKGITDTTMILALWEQIVEGKPEKVQAIQVMKQQIDNEFPLNKIEAQNK